MCCGQGRRTNHPIRSSVHQRHPGTVGVAARRRGGAAASRFEYTGPTALTVRGPLSGRTYVFAGRGAVLDVDPRDGAALLSVPGLRPIGS